MLGNAQLNYLAQFAGPFGIANALRKANKMK